jgi:hypothetical protein
MDLRLGRKLPDWANQESVGGMKFDKGIYAGIVKLNVDPLRLGRLRVWISDYGGNEDDEQGWRWVRYASPFYGSTTQNERTKTNSYDQTESVYGMWAVPPDVGNEVLCAFINGDPDRGYWFACTTTQNLSHGAVPAIGRYSEGVDKDAVKSSLVRNSLNRPEPVFLPQAEFNENDPANMTGAFLTNKLPVHEPQAEIIINQGLDTDRVRGAISSSSMRDAPSKVFGISTPGRAPDGGVMPKVRLGGHTFVMDDGDNSGTDQLIRLRTAGGHQILMNDSEQILYIANGAGTAWIEFGNSGRIDMYSMKGLAIRTQGTLDLHSDSSVNIQGDSVNIKALGSLQMQSSSFTARASTGMTLYSATMGLASAGALTVNAGGELGIASTAAELKLVGSMIRLNEGGVGTVRDPGEIQNNALADTNRDATTRLWSTVPGSLQSIVTSAPAHEPWERNTTAVSAADAFGSATTPVCTDLAPIPVLPSGGTGGAGPFGAWIAEYESSVGGYNAFNRGSSPPRGTGSIGGETINLVDMSIAEILSKSKDNESDPYKRLFAVGKYQCIPTTLSDAVKKLNVPTTQKFTVDFQDMLFVKILCRAGMASYLRSGNQNDEAALQQACIAAAAQWASVQDPRTGRGAYDGQGTNSAKATAAECKAKLKEQWAWLRKDQDAVKSSDGSVITDGSGNAIKTGSYDSDLGIKAAAGQTVVKQAPAEFMKKSDAPSPDFSLEGRGTLGDANAIPGLTTPQVKSLAVQMAFAESDSNPQYKTQFRIGRYAVNAVILSEYGFIKPDYLKQYGQDAITKANAWTGKGGIATIDSFLGNSTAQDECMFSFIQDAYKKLTTSSPRGIDFGDSICVAAGMINVAYFFREQTQVFGSDVNAMVLAAAQWRKQNTGKDNAGVSPVNNYNQGRYAIDILSQAPAATSTAPVGSAGPGADYGTESGVDPTTVMTFTSGSGDFAHYKQMPADVRTAMELMAKDYFDQTSKKITINSSYRSLEEQTAIYNAWVSAGGTKENPSAGGFYMPSKPAPSSPHLRKVAFDVAKADINKLNQLGLLEKYNFGYPFPVNDPVHIQFVG